MADQDIRTVLARMAGAPPAEASGAAVTPTRALRSAFARASETAGGLKVAAPSVAEDCLALDAVAAALNDDDLVLELRSAEGVSLGMASLDRELRAAFVESQTMGRLSTVSAPDRPVSVGDTALCAPVIDAFLIETARAAAPTSLAGWADGVRTGGRIDGGRGVTLRLPEDRYRLLSLEVDLGVTGRTGRLLIALPAARGHAVPEPAPSDWTEKLHRSILTAPAVLTAVLHRMTLPISRLEEIAPGDLLPLDGVTVSSVCLEGAGNTVVATARLGQVGGMKAVRLEAPPDPELREATPPPAALRPTAATGDALPPPLAQEGEADARRDPAEPGPVPPRGEIGSAAAPAPDALDVTEDPDYGIDVHPAAGAPQDQAPWEEEGRGAPPADLVGQAYPPDPRQT